MVNLLLPALLLTAPLEVIYHSDIQGQMATPDCDRQQDQLPDLAALAATITTVRAEAAARTRPAPVVLLGGDTIGPDPFVGGAFEQQPREGARAVVALLKKVGYEAVGLGHGDLTEDAERLDSFVEALAEAGIPAVLSNLERCAPARQRLCAAVKRSAIIEREGTRLGVVAAVLPTSKHPVGADLTLGDPVAAVRAAVRALRAQNVERVVLLAQPEAEGAFEQLYLLQRRFTGGDGNPDLILTSGLADRSGRTTVRLWRQDRAPPLVGSTFSTGSVSQVMLEPEDGGPPRVFTLPADAAHADPELRALLAPFRDRYCRRYGTAVGPGQLTGELSQADFLTYLLHVLRKETGAEIALLDREMVRSVAFPLVGRIRHADIVRALPDRAVVAVARLPGAALGALLSKLGGGRIATLGVTGGDGGPTINDRPIDAGRSYKVVAVESLVGDGGLLPHGSLRLVPIDGRRHLRQVLVGFLETRTAEEDGDPNISLLGDFGAGPDKRLLSVVIGDLNLDATTSHITNPGGSYRDPQIARPLLRAIRIDARLLLQLRHPFHELEALGAYKYGYARQEIPGKPVVAGRTQDLIDFSLFYDYRGLRQATGWGDSPWVPDPYTRLLFETSLGAPDPMLVMNAPKYHEMRISHTAGVSMQPLPRLRLRVGAGYTDELLADPDSGNAVEVEQSHTRMLVEGGAVLTPGVIVFRGAPLFLFEGELQYLWITPRANYEQQLRANARISVPLVPLLFLTIGADAFAISRGAAGWGRAYDLMFGLKIHLDAAHQRL